MWVLLFNFAPSSTPFNHLVETSMKLFVLAGLCVVVACVAVVGLAAEKVEAPCVGIDLGTTYSAVGIWQKGEVQIIPNEMGNRITPSVVAFTETERLVGDGAKNQLPQNPENTPREHHLRHQASDWSQV